MSDMHAGFLVPMVMIGFMVFAFVLMFGISYTAKVKRRRQLEEADRVYSAQYEAGNFIDAARDTLAVLNSFKPRTLTNLERADMYIRIARALAQQGSHDAVVVCTRIISLLLPEKTSIDGMEGEQERTTCRCEAQALESESAKSLVHGSVEGTQKRVHDLWKNNPNAANQLIEDLL